jgi:hypothetical protein
MWIFYENLVRVVEKCVSYCKKLKMWQKGSCGQDPGRVRDGSGTGLIWMTSRSHLDDIWVSFERHPGIIWTTSGRNLDGI